MKKFTGSNHICKTMLTFVCVVMAATIARANLLTNGSFENGPGVGGLSSNTISAGSTSITGWVVESSDIDQIGSGDFWIAADGVYSLDLNGAHGPGGIEQTFSTVSGQVYSVTFSMAGNPSFQSANMTMQVSAAGQSTNVSFSTIGHTPSNMGWVTKNWNFAANSNSSTLEFLSTFTASLVEGPALDNVSVVAVPEPRTPLLVLGGIVFLACIRWRRLT